MTDQPRLRLRIPDPSIPNGYTDEAIVPIGSNLFLAGNKFILDSSWPGSQIVGTDQGIYTLVVNPYAELYGKVAGVFRQIVPGLWNRTIVEISPPSRGYFLMNQLAIFFDFVDAAGQSLPDSWKAPL